MEAVTDQELLRKLYEAYGATVYRRCVYLLRNDEDARDAMHDVFIKVSRSLDQFRGEASPLTWITRIATNHCLNIIRARKAAWHEQFRRFVEHKAQENGPSQRLVDRNQFVQVVLALCDKETQEAAIYYFVDEMTQEEVAGVLGISVPTLRKRLRSFIDTARRELLKIDPDLRLRAAPI
ncbi:MAG: sigma-70 family RNA polymerase sigma factor [Deltaproteobacteria bacterium]|nr:sigma-70 family RNA polymerase sigma factor [Deltaproteobacteria bacterium]